MKPSIYIGLMSGTSLDSIDIGAFCFDTGCALIGKYSLDLPPDVRSQILKLNQPGTNEIDTMGPLERDLADLFARGVNELLAKHSLQRSSIAAIGSHGQTIRHRPELGFTLQIGDPNRIAEKTGITTVADFRRRDVAAEGQGAPLVPAFHKALFQSNQQQRFIVNIGGMANVSILPKTKHNPVQGYDTGPGNVLMDAWIQQQRQLSYDKDGRWAATGKVNQPLLSHLLDLAFYQQTPPKSTGREQFNLTWLNNCIARLGPPPEPEDVQATLLELTAQSISDAVKQHQGWKQSGVYLCGGGAQNQALKQRIAALLTPANLSTTDALGLPVDWVEAAAFAWLAYRTMHHLPGNEPSATGASGERILGAIYPA